MLTLRTRLWLLDQVQWRLEQQGLGSVCVCGGGGGGAKGTVAPRRAVVWGNTGAARQQAAPRAALACLPAPLPHPAEVELLRRADGGAAVGAGAHARGVDPRANPAAGTHVHQDRAGGAAPRGQRQVRVHRQGGRGEGQGVVGQRLRARRGGCRHGATSNALRRPLLLPAAVLHPQRPVSPGVHRGAEQAAGWGRGASRGCKRLWGAGGAVRMGTCRPASGVACFARTC